MRKPNRTRLAVVALTAAALTCSLGLTAVPAYAVSYPSWNDVQQAKGDVTAKQQMIDKVTGLIGSLQTQLTAARTAAEKANEEYFQAKDKLDKATAKAADLSKQAADAQTKADTSKETAGLAASTFTKGGGQSLPGQLLLSTSSKESDGLLYRMGTMSNLTGKFQALHDQAQKDANAASALTAQAKDAQAARSKAASAAADALDSAQAAQASAQSALNTQEQQSQVLVAQLATLRNTSASVEQSYLDGQAAARAAQAAAAAAAAAKAAADRAAQEAAQQQQQQQQQHNGGGSSSSGGGSPAGGGSSGSGGGGSAPSGGGGSAPAAPHGNTVEAAIAYAQAQLGKPYIFGGEGPRGYDCSGLTMKAYAAAGLYIGSHSVNNQWYTASGRGQIVPYSQRQRGDLIFWGSGPGDFYHIGLYIGGGMMIAAPTEGDVVKIQSVWGTPYSRVARPSA